MSAVKIILGIAGAGLLYEWYTGGLSTLLGGAGTSTETPPVTTTPAGTVPAPTTTPPTTTATPPATSQLAQQAAAGALLGISQWNWYARLADPVARIIIGPTSAGSALINYNQYVALFKETGVLTSLTGLGRIIDLASLFQGVTPGSGFGEREFSALGSIVDDSMNSAGYIDESPFVAAATSTGNDSTNVSDFILASRG